ncbi:MAG: BamA/TamA family outer membrane protein, partial [Kiritimatiellia bacterium]|nr:BamA/TamA family outer membrane protein [Kiritimatiellia bacterium]
DRISLGYQLTQFEVYGVDSRASALTRQEEGEIRLGSLVSRWTHDQRNRSFRPTQGWLSSLEPFWGSSALGGDVDVWGVEARASVYYSPWAEHVLNVRGTFRSVDSLDSADRAPLALRHFLGGSADLRGFEYRTVSPRDAEGNRTGGQTAWWTALEYTVPVFSRLDLSAYYEMGDVGAESFRFQGEGPVSDWGLGLTVRADNFPIRIDVAFPVATVEGDPDNKPGQPRFSFSVGYGL